MSDKMKGFFKVRTGFLCVILCVLLGAVMFTQSTVYRIQGDRDNDVNIRGVASNFTFTNAVGDATNQSYITVTAKDKTGNTVPFGLFNLYLSDNTDGRGVTATQSSGTAGLTVGTGAGSETGTLMGMSVGTGPALTSGKFNVTGSRVPIQVMADSTGTVKYGVIDSAKTLFVPCANSVLSGNKCGTALTAGSYK